MDFLHYVFRPSELQGQYGNGANINGVYAIGCCDGFDWVLGVMGEKAQQEVNANMVPLVCCSR